MSKSRDAFRTISEVADWLDTPAHVLRFWESKFSQVKPVKRAGGRRYYRPSDMELLGGIKRLLHEDGMTIKGVQKILREKGVKHVAGLSPQRGALDDDAQTVDATATPQVRADDAPFTHVTDEAETVVPFQQTRPSAPDVDELDAGDAEAPGRDDADLVAGAAAEPPTAEDAAAIPGGPIADDSADDSADETVETASEPATFEGEDAPAGAAASPLPAFLQKPLNPDEAAPEPADTDAEHEAQDAAATGEAEAPDTSQPAPPAPKHAPEPETAQEQEPDFAQVLAEETARAEDLEALSQADADEVEATPVAQDVSTGDALDGADAAPAPLLPDRDVPDDPDEDALDVARGPLSYLPLTAPLEPAQVQALGPLVRRLQTLSQRGPAPRQDG